MMRIQFTKAHGARNDFLLTWSHKAPVEALLSKAAQAICDRNAGAGADGWLLVTGPISGKHASIRLFNPDGGEAEISGNGTRCAAAFLCDSDLASDHIIIQTGAGPKELTLLDRQGLKYLCPKQHAHASHPVYVLHSSACTDRIAPMRDA